MPDKTQDLSRTGEIPRIEADALIVPRQESHQQAHTVMIPSDASSTGIIPRSWMNREAPDESAPRDADTPSGT